MDKGVTSGAGHGGPSTAHLSIDAARVSSGVVAAIGLAGLIGWLADVRVLVQPSRLLAPMSLLTALLLCVAGAALLARTWPHSRALRGLRAALGCVILLCGAAVIAALVTRGGLPTDTWMMDRRVAAGLGSHLNRMSPISAACFVLLGGVVCLDTVRWRGAGMAAQALAAAGLLLAVVSLIGYLYAITNLVALGADKPIAPQTALAFALAFATAFAAAPHRGVMKIILGRETGGILARRLLVFVIVLPLILGGIASALLHTGVMGEAMTIFFLTGAMNLSLAGLLLFNAFTINRTESARHAAQVSLEQSENAYRTIFEGAADPLFLVDSRHRVIEANRAAAVSLGQRRSALPGRDAAELFMCPPAIHAWIDRAFAQGHAVFEASACTPDGTSVPLEMNARTIDYRRERTVLIGARDLSERRRAEKSLAEKEALLQQARKMEAVGRLAGGVAHDFNNLLTVIMGYAELLLGKIEPGHEARHDAYEIKVCGARAAALTRQLLAFSRTQPAQPRVTDINVVLRDMEPLLRRLIGERIRLDITTMPCLPAVVIDPHQLEQVVMNLAVNGRDAMPEGGSLRIATRCRRIDGETIPFTPAPQDGPYVELVVSDSGTGIPTDVMPHIFEPFFTTKRAAQGTGLGLSTVYGIVTQNKGAIGLQTSTAAGTTMSVLFPPAETAADGTPARLPERGEARGSGSVLLVEDDEPVRGYLAAGLRRAGFTVQEAGSGAEALSAIEAGGRYQYVVSDVVMPGLGGRDLALELGRRLPGVHIVFISGYDEAQAGEIGALCGRFDFVMKPFTVPDLVEKLQDGERERAVGMSERSA
jgi:two-component system, cell cycle sensor histidine kinase and response regulator CckA